MTRHVRTPAGVRFYHKPIGTPLGRSKAGEAKAIVKAAAAFAHDTDAAKLHSLDGQKVEALKHGGFSLNARGESPKSGFMVSLDDAMGGHEQQLKGHATLADIAKHRAAIEQQLLADPTLYHGGWNEGDHDTLDLSRNVQGMKAALAAAIKHKQRAVYDVANDRAIDTDDLAKLVKGLR